MTFAKRLGFYGFGFSIGIVLLLFFLNGKNSGCDYMPNARILKLIRNKPLIYSDKAQESMKTLALDSLDIKKMLIDGEIDFSKSITRQKPCRFYLINGLAKNQSVAIYIENCDSLATLKSVVLTKNK